VGKLVRRTWFWPLIAGIVVLVVILSTIWAPAGLAIGKLHIGPMRITFSSLVSIAGFAIALALAIPNLSSLAEEARSTNYAQLDTMYADILKMAIERPWLRSPDALTEEHRAIYDTYAYIVWNFLETVRDRCAGDLELQSIWAPVIASEAAIHGSWFVSETEGYDRLARPKFRPEFVDFVWASFGPSLASVCGNPLRGDGGWIGRSWEPRLRGEIESDPAAMAWRQLPAPGAETGTSVSSN
jgi:hypothetical protein